MRIIVVRHSIRNRGGDRLVLDYLAHLVKKGHEIVYWTNEINTSFLIDPKIDIKSIPYKGVLGTMLFVLLRKFNADVVMVDLVVMAFLGSLRNRKRILYLAQDYDVSYHRFWLIKSFIEFCYRVVLNQKKIKTIAVSQGLSDKLQKYKPQQLITISNGVDLSFFYRDPQSTYIPKKQQSLTILLFARLDHRKGLDIGIKSLEHLLNISGVPSWEVWIIGTEQVHIKGVQIKNLGFLDSDSKLREVFSAADIYLVPSRSEGLSLLLLQALACECAVVSTEASSIIQHEINGLISPIEDAQTLSKNLYRVMTEERLRLTLKKNARLLAEQYSMENSCREFEKVLFGFVNHS